MSMCHQWLQWHQENVYHEEFCVFSSKPLANTLFQKFYLSPISYCLPIIFTYIYASDKKGYQSFKDCSKLSIEYHDIDLHIQKLKHLPSNI